MKWNNLLCIPIVDYFIIAGCKIIDLNCLISLQVTNTTLNVFGTQYFSQLFQKGSITSLIYVTEE